MHAMFKVSAFSFGAHVHRQSLAPLAHGCNNLSFFVGKLESTKTSEDHSTFHEQLYSTITRVSDSKLLKFVSGSLQISSWF